MYSIEELKNYENDYWKASCERLEEVQSQLRLF